MRNILLLGGTGAMGTHLTEILAADKDNTVFVTTRRNRTPNQENIKYLLGNAHDQEFLLKVLTLKQWDAIVDFMVYGTDEFKSKCPLFLKLAKQYVFLSSSRVYAESHVPLTEESPRLIDVCQDEDYLETDEYALAKGRQENILFNSNFNNWTIIRPYITFDEYRLQLSCEEKESWLFRALNRKSIIISEDLLSKITTFTYGADVANGIAAIICEENAMGEAFHITCDITHTWNDILGFYLDAIQTYAGFRPKVIVKPNYVPYFGGSALQVKYDRLYSRIFDNSKIRAFMPEYKFTDTKCAIFNCISHFVKHPSWNFINWGQEALKDKEAREFIRWKEIRYIRGTKQLAIYIIKRFGIKL